MKKIYIVLLHFKAYKELLAGLHALKKLQSSNYFIKIVVVDNQSDKKKLTKVKKKFPKIIFIPKKINTGVAKGFNIGYRYAISKGADYVMMFSPDLRMNSDALVKLAEVMEEDPRIGVAACKMLIKTSPARIFFVQGRLDPKTKTTIHVGLSEIDKGQYDSTQENDFLNCPLLVKREIFTKVGYFSEELFQYYEDTDWHTRIKKAGFQLICVKNAIAWNLQADTDIHTVLPKKEYYLTRNHLWFVRQNFPRVEQLVVYAYTFWDLLILFLQRKRKDNNIRFRYGFLGVKDFLINRMGEFSYY